MTIYELIAGRVPFTDGDVTYHHRHTEPPDIRTLVDGIPEELAVLLHELLAKTPDGRPETTAEVATRLDRILATLG